MELNVKKKELIPEEHGSSVSQCWWKDFTIIKSIKNLLECMYYKECTL